MSGIRKKIENNYLFGCIRYKDKYKIYLMPIAYWILNYSKYDPAYNPGEWEFVFRDNVLIVTDDRIKDFLRAVEGDSVDLSEQLSEINNIPKKSIEFNFFVDLDEKLFVSSFPDIEVEEYLPDNSWTGKYDNPITYLPNNIKEIFR